MAGGGIGDLFGALGSGLAGLAGQAGGGGGGGGGGTTPDFGVTPENAGTNILTNPLVGAEEALNPGTQLLGQDQQRQDQQQQQQLPDQPTFTPPPQQPQAQVAQAQGAMQPVKYLPPGAIDPNQAAPAGTVPPQAAQPVVSRETSTGLTPQAEIAAGYRPPEATDADLAQAAEEKQRKQGATPINIEPAKPAAPPEPQIGASSINTDQQAAEQPGQQAGQRQQNPLTTAGNFLKNVAKPGSAGTGAGAGAGGGINPLAALLGLPQNLLSNLLGLTNQVGSAYGPQQDGSQGAIPHGYGYGADQPPVQAAVQSPPTQQQSSAPQPPSSPLAQVAQAAARDPSAAVPAGDAQAAPAAVPGAPAAAVPAATPASLTTGVTGPGIVGDHNTPIAAGEIQMSGYSRHGAPSMQPTQASVDVSPLQREADDRQMMLRAAQMVSQEVSLRPGNIKAQMTQLETARNRALYGIAGNGRYPDGTRAPQSLGQALQTVGRGSRYANEGYSGYYPDYSGQRVSPAQLAAFERDVWNPVMHQGSNKSDVGWGPMTGNASNDPRRGERGMVAKHQYMKGTQGYSMRKAGGDDYFREHVGPGQGLPEMGGGANTAQRLSDQQASEMEGVVNTTAQLAPRGLPWQQYRRSQNVEDVTGPPTLSQDEARAAEVERDRARPPGRTPITAMSRAAGFGDIDPLLDDLARQYAMQTMAGPVPMPRPRPRM